MYKRKDYNAAFRIWSVKSKIIAERGQQTSRRTFPPGTCVVLHTDNIKNIKNMFFVREICHRCQANCDIQPLDLTVK